MGIYSTMEIPREEALEQIQEALEELDEMSNEKLADLMFALFGDEWGANFTVLDNNDDDEEEEEYED